jgi:hypothetical protein
MLAAPLWSQEIKLPGAKKEINVDPVDMEAPQTASFDKPAIQFLENRRVLMIHPVTKLEWPLEETIRAVDLNYGFDPVAYHKGKTNGADLILEITGKGPTREVFRRRINPMGSPADRGVLQSVVILPPFETGARLILRTTGGEFDDTAWDWLFLSKLRFRRDVGDAAAQFPNFSRVPKRARGDNTGIFKSTNVQPYLFAAAPSIFEFTLDPADHRLLWDYGFQPSAYTNGGHTNGAIFRVELKTKTGTVKKLFERYLRPYERPADRKIAQSAVTIPAHALGDELIVSVLPGDGGDASYDHTFIKKLVIE